MAEEKKPEFTVTDRRRFVVEDDAVTDKPREQAPERPTAEPPRAAAPQPAPPSPPREDQVPLPPSVEERQAQHDAFKESSKQLDDQIRSELGGRNAKDLEVSFERFIASLYMSALMQLGLVHEQGAAPVVDLIGARQTVDTLGMLADKTKGNLNAVEDNLMQNVLYELRMAYVEVTNALAKGAPTPGAPPPPGGLHIK